MFIDVHCHLTGGEYEGVGGVEAVLSRARDAGVTAFVSSGFDLDSSRAAAELSARHADVYFTAGFQPEELGKYREGDLAEIAALAKESKCVAIGEIGLDYHFQIIPRGNCRGSCSSASSGLRTSWVCPSSCTAGTGRRKRWNCCNRKRTGSASADSCTAIPIRRKWSGRLRRWGCIFPSEARPLSGTPKSAGERKAGAL